LSGTLKTETDISGIIRERHERIKRLDSTIKKGSTYFYVVMNPDYASFMETRRLVRDLENIPVKIGAVIINKIMPPNIPKEYRGDQDEIICAVEKEFGRFKIIRVPFNRDVGFLLETIDI